MYPRISDRAELKNSISRCAICAKLNRRQLDEPETMVKGRAVIEWSDDRAEDALIECCRRHLAMSKSDPGLFISEYRQSKGEMFDRNGPTDCWPWKHAIETAPNRDARMACMNPICCNPRHVVAVMAEQESDPEEEEEVYHERKRRRQRKA